jgi:predicted permease
MPHRDFVSGDLEEEYTESVRPEVGKLRADLWFVGQAMRSVASFAPPNKGVDRSRIPSPPVPREARHAMRGLARSPGFSALAIVTLAVGIGTVTSVFSVADAVLFRVVAGVERPEELAMVHFAREKDGGEAPVSLPNLRDLGAGSPGVSAIAGYSRARLQVSADGLPARTAWSQIVTGAYFELLGVKPARGRLFTRQEAEAPDGRALVVMSDAFWRRVFQSDPGAIGRTLRINGLPFTVVGVTPPEFRGVERLDSLELWVPASQHVALRHGQGIPGWELEGRGAAHFANTLIRIAPGTSPAAVERQLRAAMAQLVEAYPADNEVYREALPTVDAAIGLAPRDRARLDPTLKVLAGLVAVILLVTCANVANLLVLRGLRRREETALRSALGAARTHLVLQNLAEALLLALPAALLGLVIALGVNEVLWGTGLFPHGVAEHTAIDGRVFAFAAWLGVLTATTFGLLPALLHGRGDQGAALKSAHRSSSRTAVALQGGLSVAQLALSLALVGGVLLLSRTSANLTSIDPGFSPEHVLAMEINPGPQGYRGAEVDGFRTALVEQVAGLSGVEAVAASGFPPFGHISMQLQVRHPVDATRMLSSRADWVTDGFFETLGVPILAGRAFAADETTTLDEESRPVVLGRSLAARLFGTPERSVGRSLDAAVFGQPMPVHVVGVAEDIIDADLRRDPYPKMYVAMPGSPQSFTTLLVRTGRPLDAVAGDVRGVLGGIDADVPLGSVTELSRLLAGATVRERTFARLAALLAAIAILLAGVGLYSVVAYAAAQRRREFGIRIAVGASGVGITRLVLGHALVFGLGGVAVGLAVSVAGSRLLAGVVFGVAPTDPVSLGAAAGVLLMVTVAASLVPAWGATKVDAGVVLRGD